MTATSPPLVETVELTKEYPTRLALDRCTLEVAAGEIFGVLGPNGAGKSTMMRLLLGYLRPTSGTATIGGMDSYRQRVRVHEQVSFLPGDARLFPKMRGRDVLKFFCAIRKSADPIKAKQLAERLDLDLTSRVAYMSTGMRQKLALVVAFSANTPLIILDEPTANLDPNVRSEIIRLVQEAKGAGSTVIFSSHVLSEVEESCDRVVIIRGGRLVHTQVMSELRRQHRIRALLQAELPPLPDELAKGVRIRQEGTRLTIETEDELSPLLGWLATCTLSEMNVEPVGLRAVYDRYQAEPV